MLIVKEQVVKELISMEDAFASVEAVFSSMARGDAYNFPVIREDIGYADALYGFKSGFDRSGKALGLKSGGYWPGNMERGLTNHQSTVFLFNPDTGQPYAMVGGNYLTAIRTAAASAVSIKYLAREDVKILGVVGAGHQAPFQIRAALAQRNFTKIVGWNIDSSMLDSLEVVADEHGLSFESVERQELAKVSDVIITITSCFEPLLMKEWIKPGAHIACMGTDTKGKQEVDAALVASATAFTDDIRQSIEIGECQHAYGNGSIKENQLTGIGQVINGDHMGRSTEEQITLFDGTGVALQDLAVASKVAKLALEKDKAIILDIF